jgi:hypothetical protein
VLLVEDAAIGGDGSIAIKMHAERPGRDLPASAEDLHEAIHRHEFFERLDRYLRRGRELGGMPQGSIPGNAYVVHTGSSAIALAAATAKTVMYVNSPAANQPSFTEIGIGFDGVTATNAPVLAELVYGTKASNSTPGTASTTFTPLQLRGWPGQASAQAAANNCTTEPTVLTAIKQWLIRPDGGLLVIQSPLGREPTALASGAAISGIQVGLRLTAPQIVNTRSYLEFEE